MQSSLGCSPACHRMLVRLRPACHTTPALTFEETNLVTAHPQESTRPLALIGSSSSSSRSAQDLSAVSRARFRGQDGIAALVGRNWLKAPVESVVASRNDWNE
eukprot:351965-Chlamydomonas_euryale.AAC.24